MSHYVYILSCADNTLYTGYTTNPKRRLKEHNQGVGAKYTRGRTPVKLCFLEEHPNRSKAQKREYAIKKLKRKEKLELIKEDLDE